MRSLYAAVIAIVLGSFVNVGTVDAQMAPGEFAGGTAHQLEQGSWEVGLFGPLRYGVSDSVELSAHPLLFFVVPNLQAKIGWTGEGSTQVATVHSVTYPTMLMRLLAMEGAGGVLPPDRAIPQILSIRNEVVITQEMGAHLLTGAVGVQVGPRMGESELISIDLPVVYPRTAAFFTTFTALSRLQVQGPIAGSLGYRTGAKFFVYPGAEGSFAAEIDARLQWRSSGSWMIQAGVVGSLAGYPFGLGADLLPLADIMWTF